MAENEPQLQSGLGEFTDNKTETARTWNQGYLAYAKVIRVHPKRYTADVQVYHTNDEFRSTQDNEGRFACRIGVNSAGFSDVHNRPFGEILPIHAGDIVLIGFLKNSKDQPVILRSIHSGSENSGDANLRNILQNQYSVYTEGDIENYVKIHPNQDFFVRDKWGNMEFASTSKSFFVAKEHGADDEEFDFENLSVKTSYPDEMLKLTTDGYTSEINPVNAYTLFDNAVNDLFKSMGLGDWTKMFDAGDNSDQANQQREQLMRGQTITADEKYSQPKKWMACFRDKFLDKETNWLKIIANAAKTSFRLIKFQQKENKNTQLELTEAGDIIIKRQLDTRHLFGIEEKQTEDNKEQNPSKVFSQIQLKADGTIAIQTVDKSGWDGVTQKKTDEDKLPFPITSVVIEPKGGKISIVTSSGISCYAEDDIGVVCRKGIDIKAEEDINIASKKNVNVTAMAKIDMAAPNTDITSAVDIAGSMDMKGDTHVVGNTAIVGKTLINARQTVVRGDIDTDRDTNHARFGSLIQSIAEGFIRKQCMKNMALGNSATVGLLGMINANTMGFSIGTVTVNGKATTMYESTIGDVMNWSPENREKLIAYCLDVGKDSNSMAAQLEFIKDPLKGLGIDLGMLDNLGDDLSNLEKIIAATSHLFSAVEQSNNVGNDSNAVKSAGTTVAGDGSFTLSAELEQQIQEAFLSAKLTLKASSLHPTSIVNDKGDAARVCDISSIIKEGDKKKTTPSSSDSTSYSEEITYTVEDALLAVGKYVNEGILSQVQIVAIKLDSLSGMNTRQYAAVNRKITRWTGGTTGSSGESSSRTFISEPAPCTTLEQYCDRLIKRYVYKIAIDLLNRANASWNYDQIWNTHD